MCQLTIGALTWWKKHFQARRIPIATLQKDFIAHLSTFFHARSEVKFDVQAAFCVLWIFFIHATGHSVFTYDARSSSSTGELVMRLTLVAEIQFDRSIDV